MEHESTAPLLGSSQQDHREEAELGNEDSNYTECGRILTIALPVCITEVLSFGSYTFTTAQVGHLGALQLSALGLGQVLFNVTGLSFVVGITSAIETFAGQAFGAQQYALVGVTLQRAVLLCTLSAFPPMVLWIWAADILKLLGQSRNIIPAAVTFVQWAMPVLLVAGSAEACRKYLASQAVVRPLAVVSAITVFLTPFINWLFLYILKWDLPGAAMAYLTIDTCTLLLLVTFITWYNAQLPQDKRTWQGWSSQSLAGWGTYLHVALPSAIMMMLDWWTFEAMILIAGLLPDAEVAVGAMSSCFLTHATVFMAISGLAVAVSTRVSNELGAGNAKVAKRAMRLCLYMGLLLSAAAAVGLIAARNVWGIIFSSDRAVARSMADMLPWLAMALLGDAVNAVLSGVLRGCGRQTLGVAINLVFYWVLGLPLAAYAGLGLGMGGPGIWMVMAVVQNLQGIAFALIVLQFDWAAEARRAQDRVQDKDHPVVVEHLPNTLMDV